MRGIILAGGTGSRLGLLTRHINKHCLPLYDRPMVVWPFWTLRDSGITDITVVSTPSGVGQIHSVLGGACKYSVQTEAGGIPQAIACADDSSEESVAVILGDNLFIPNPLITASPGLAHCYLYKPPADRLPEFGVPEFRDNKITRVVEKPREPPSPYAVTGLYVFPCNVFAAIRALKRSGRGEYEVSDLLNYYADVERLDYTVVGGYWGDAGTVDDLADCTAAAKRWKDGIDR